MYKTTLGELMEWQRDGNYPEWAETFMKNQKVLAYKRDLTIKPALNWEDIHPYAKAAFCKIQSFFDTPIFLTGSWVNGTWCHPEDKPEYADLRKSVGKSVISDIDIYLHTPDVSNTRKKLWQIGDQIDVKVDYVSWWGVGINPEFGLIACNDRNRLGGGVKKQYRNHYTAEELSNNKHLFYNVSG